MFMAPELPGQPDPRLNLIIDQQRLMSVCLFPQGLMKLRPEVVVTALSLYRFKQYTGDIIFILFEILFSLCQSELLLLFNVTLALLIERRSEEHTSELQSRGHLVCRLLLEKKNNNKNRKTYSEHFSRY